MSTRITIWVSAVSLFAVSGLSLFWPSAKGALTGTEAMMATALGWALVGIADIHKKVVK